MFTGIIERTAKVETIDAGETSIRLALRLEDCDWQFALGDSLAVNGCCLTVVGQERSGLALILLFDLLRETWTRTSFPNLQPGAAVNVERSLESSGRLHGHFVTGHVDTVARIAEWKLEGADWKLELEVPPAQARQIAEKGSVSVDGISLTVARATSSRCTLWIIPHTRAVTNLRERAAGDLVNLETDILAKYVERLAHMPV